MATAEKLAKLNETKADLKAALIEKGQNPGDVFATYPDLVRAIQTGGGGGTTAIMVKSNNSYAQVFDTATKTFITPTSSGITVTVTDHLLVKNMDKLMTGNVCRIVLKNGTTLQGSTYATDNAGVIGFYELSGCTWSIEFSLAYHNGEYGISASDIDYIQITVIDS